jgi:hypothetical protein
MFGIFSRPNRPTRNTRRTTARTTLRVEALEARANPDSTPVLTAVTATWSDPTHVVISGTVTDDTATTSTVLVGGATTATITTTTSGTFTTALVLNQPGTVLLAAPIAQTTGITPITAVTEGQPTLSNVTITQIDGTWHIRGNVTGGDPVGTVIHIISSIPSINGQTSVVTNPDGSFDIGLNLPPGTPGGSISIVLDDGDGVTFDNWAGFIG